MWCRGKRRGTTAPGVGIGMQPATYVADDVVHVRVTLNRHEFVDLHAARNADATQVVALQVDQHHVLGAFLRMPDQFADLRKIVIAC